MIIMAKNYFLYALSLFVCLTLLSPVSCYAQYYFFIFGDSLNDPGNNQFTSPDGHFPSYDPPYGETFFGRPTGRYSDGRVPADFIATFLGIPFIPPALNQSEDFSCGASFAAGGAGVFDLWNETMNLENQYGNFTRIVGEWREELPDDEVDKRLKEAVYLIAIGGNDYFSFNTNNFNASFFQMEEYVGQVIGNLSIVIEKIYNNGARKFMFQSVSPLGCIPMMKGESNVTGNGCARQVLTLAALHNGALSKMVESMKKSYPDFIYSIFDFYTALGERISYPTTYGLVVGDAPCLVDGVSCENPSEYVFWDGGHNTDATYHQLAQLMWNGNSTFVSPYTMEELFRLGKNYLDVIPKADM